MTMTLKALSYLHHAKIPLPVLNIQMSMDAFITPVLHLCIIVLTLSRHTLQRHLWHRQCTEHALGVLIRTGVYQCTDGVYLCMDGVYQCTDGVYLCMDGVYQCTDGVYLCMDGVYQCTGGVYQCTDWCIPVYKRCIPVYEQYIPVYERCIPVYEWCIPVYGHGPEI